MVEPYHYWKFRAAAEVLAGAEAPLRRRIMFALMSFAGLRDQDLPPAIRELYLEIQAHVTWNKEGDPEEGLWQNTLRAMSDEDAKKVAELILHLYELTCREIGPGDPIEP